jgi:hypothetical protein
MTWHLDAAIAQADGVIRWVEHIHGGEAHCMLNARHLARVLAARPAYLTSKPRLRYVVPTLRLVKPDRKVRSA